VQRIKTPHFTAKMGAFLSTGGPTLLCSGRRWRGPRAGRDFEMWWRAIARAVYGGRQQRR